MQNLIKKINNVKLNYTENIILFDNKCVEFNYIVENYSTFGDWLKSLRKTNELSQEDLAKRSGVTKSYISKLEKNQVEQPRLYQIEKICKALNASFTDAKNLLYLPNGNSEKLPEPLHFSDFDGFDKGDLQEIAAFIKFKKTQKQQ